MENIEIGKRYKSKVSSVAVGCEYEVVKKIKLLVGLSCGKMVCQQKQYIKMSGMAYFVN